MAIEDWEEPTPTLREFVYSFTPSQSVPRDLEGAFYLQAKLYLAFYPAMLRVAYLMGRGYPLAEAAYIAGDSYSLLSFMKKAQTVGKFVGRTPGVIARNPVLLAPLAGVWLAQAVIRDPHFQQTGTPKLGIPLPIWLSIVRLRQGPLGSGVESNEKRFHWMTKDGHFHVGYSFNPHWI